MYIRCLTGLRAFAIVLVLISHLPDTPNFPASLRNAIHFFGFGTIGVRLFFLLSGYLITHVLLGELHKTGRISLLNFFMRRVVRIFPSFYFYLFCLFFLKYFGVLDIAGEAIVYSFFYVQNYNVFQNIKSFPTSWLVQHSWSLSVEEQFYVIYPFIFKKLRHWISTYKLKIVIVIVFVCTFFRALNYSFPEVSKYVLGPFFMHADFILVGCALRLFIIEYLRAKKDAFYRFKYTLLFAAFLLALACSIIEYKTGYLIMICGAFILISNAVILSFFILYPESVIGRFFETKGMIFIGTLSYSLYIWQQLFLGSTHLWKVYQTLTWFPINLVLIFGVSLFSYYAIEKPFLRLKYNFAS